MGCHCALENVSNQSNNQGYYLLSRTLLALRLGKLEIQLLLPTQAVNSHSKVTYSKGKMFWFLLFAFDMRVFMVQSE